MPKIRIAEDSILTKFIWAFEGDKDYKRSLGCGCEEVEISPEQFERYKRLHEEYGQMEKELNDLYDRSYFHDKI